MQDPDDVELVLLIGDELRELESFNLADLDSLPEATAEEVEYLLRRLFPPPPRSWWDDIGNVDDLRKKLRRDGLL